MKWVKGFLLASVFYSGGGIAKATSETPCRMCDPRPPLTSHPCQYGTTGSACDVTVNGEIQDGVCAATVENGNVYCDCILYMDQENKITKCPAPERIFPGALPCVGKSVGDQCILSSNPLAIGNCVPDARYTATGKDGSQGCLCITTPAYPCDTSPIPTHQTISPPVTK